MVVNGIDWSGNRKFFLQIVEEVQSLETWQLLHFFTRGDKWKPLKGKIRVLGIKKANRPEVFRRLRFVLYCLIEGRLPEATHWATYIFEKFPLSKGEPILSEK